MSNQPSPLKKFVVTQAMAEQTMKSCQVGTRNYADANNLHAACYGAIGSLLLQRDALVKHIEALINCADINRDLTEIRAAKATLREIL